MKKYNFSILLIFISLLLCNSCVDEERLDNRSNIEEGIPTTATLSFAAEKAPEIETKSALTEREEYKVDNLHVFVFKQEGGSWVKENYQLFENLSSETDKGTGTVVTSGTVKLKTTSGQKRIYAIANANGKITKTILEGVTSIEGLKALSYEMAEKTVYRTDGVLLMSGVYVTGNTNKNEGEVGIQTNGTVESGSLKLAHLDSRITFSVSAKEGLGITFTPKEWKVVNVPIKSNVFSNPSDVSTSYFNTGLTNFEATDLNKEDESVGGSFTFYMMENRKDAKYKNIVYADRERQTKNPIEGSTNVLNGDFVNADEYATYVVMTGSFYQKYEEDGVMKEKRAEVQYTVHLGYVDDDAADFKSLRACHYTYNVSVAGVSNIELEVTSFHEGEKTTQENQPGAEGDVIKANDFYYLDAHYETRVITFKRSAISDQAQFRVRTPFDPDGRGDNATDINWVWFVQNDKENTAVAGHYEYPADSKRRLSSIMNNKNWATAGWTGRNIYEKDGDEMITIRKGGNSGQTVYIKRIWHDAVDGGYKYKTDVYHSFNGTKLTVKELIEKLKNEKEATVSKTSIYDSEGNASFTVFVDEFYYNEHPLTKARNAVLWKKFVNVPNREMHILCDTELSQDQASSLTTTSFLISQRSIKTFYNPQANGLTSAWGMETIREGDRLGMAEINDNGLSKTNGRDNMSKIMGGFDGNWSTYIDHEHNTLRSGKEDIAYACMQRNRDENGDNLITDGEVKWYLPAINQMTGMWIGRDGLSSEAYLFKDKASNVVEDNRRKYHFMNSNAVMFWAEEGSSTGYRTDENSFDYRCVRNLGTYRSEPQDYVNYNANTRTFDLSFMNNKALKPTPNTNELAVADELDVANRPYKSFKVASGVTSGEITKEGVFNGTGVSPCVTYSEGNDDTGTWRMPNQRELSLILAYCDVTSNGGLMSRTTSSLLFKRRDKIVYMLDSNNEIITLSGDRGKVRCVKDIR